MKAFSLTFSSVPGRLVVWELGASSKLTGEGRDGQTKHTRKVILAMNGRSPLLVLRMPRVLSLRRCKLYDYNFYSFLLFLSVLVAYTGRSDIGLPVAEVSKLSSPTLPSGSVREFS